MINFAAPATRLETTAVRLRWGCAFPPDLEGKRAKASAEASMMRGPVRRTERAVRRRRATRGSTLPWASMNNGELVAETLVKNSPT